MLVGVAVMLLLFSFPAVASTWVVDAAGGGDFSSIQAALDTAADGDTIYVRNGDYDEGTTADAGFFGVVLEVKSDVRLIGESVDGVVVHSALASTPTRATSIYVDAGTYSALLIAQMTIINTQPGNENQWWGQEVAYSAIQQGGGYNAGSGALTVDRVVFSLPEDHPKIFYCPEWADLDSDFENLTVDFGSTAGDIVYIDYMGAGSRLHNSILWNTTGWSRNWGVRDYSSLLATGYDDLFGSSSTYAIGDILDDPDLVGGGDEHLSAGSPAADAGDPDPTWNDEDGSRNDMGAFGGTPYAFPHDADGDGYSDDGSFGLGLDCDDGDGDVHPSATEVCDGIDNDCDGTTDVGAADASTYYIDADADGFGDPASPVPDCTVRVGIVADDNDCDDTLSGVNPSSPELCDGFDDNCDGVVDEDAADPTTWYADADGDGHGDRSSSFTGCTALDGFVSSDDDCDDTSAAVFPGAVEVCNSVDDDCDGTTDIDAIGMTTWYADVDRDDYGDAYTSTSACDVPVGFVADDGDCDDKDASINPGEIERCDPSDVDENCDGLADDAAPALDPSTLSVWFVDADGDGYGDADESIIACNEPIGTVVDPTDCDDADTAYHPGATENDCTDPADYNCDGSIDYADADGDDFAACEDCDDLDPAVNPTAAEIVGDTVDENCDGLELCYPDVDGDGFRPDDGAPVSSTGLSCDSPGEASAAAPGGDCDDNDPTVYPGAQDAPGDGIDEDCDGSDPASDTADTGEDGYDNPPLKPRTSDTGSGSASACGCATPTSSISGPPAALCILALVYRRRARR